MRLLRWNESETVSLTQDFIDGEIPPYAIFSHTWGHEDDEVTFSDIQHNRGQNKVGYAKIRFCIKQSRLHGINYFWMDTCCIDKTNYAELSEAITSMFRWYRNAEKCYVYLSDVSVLKRDGQNLSSWESSFRSSRWFTRYWTLQELLAPRVVEFFSRDGKILGTKMTLIQQIHEITTISIAALEGTPLSQFSIDERIRWTKGRYARKKEDQAYSLLGIFNVFMPLIYGEGDNAFHRLSREIRKQSNRTKSSPPPQQLLNSTRQTKLVESEDGMFYNRLPKSSFRLLSLDPGRIGESITGQMGEHSLTNPPIYYALSYVWGHEPELHRAVINGTLRMIQPNLFHALQRVRSQNGQCSIWADALCINQSDSWERTIQISQMDTIYSGAEGVFIWLGEEDSTSKPALEFVSEITSNKFRWDDRWWGQEGFENLAQLLERPWFRRGWVLQEAAFSRNSVILCGDHEIYMGHFITAIKTVRDRLSIVPLSVHQNLARFHDSPAIRLLDTVTSVFRNSSKGEIPCRRLSLEALVDLSTYSETTDPRDTIYALLNLANDVASSTESHRSAVITPDYTKPVLDVFGDFILHCCSRSNKLDIICRPWAPVLSTKTYPKIGNESFDYSVRTYPSWICSRESLPYSNPSWRLKYRLRGNPLVNGSHLRRYYAHYGLKPQVSIGIDINGVRDGSLKARGFSLGEITERSVRMAEAIITKDCIDILRAPEHDPYCGSDEIPDSVWRTLCADSDENGDHAPHEYEAAMVCSLEVTSSNPTQNGPANLLDQMSSIDPEEILEHEIPYHVEQFIKIVRDVVWNRRTFRLEQNNNVKKTLVGLIPRHAKVGDQVCILYGCSVPVVLRKLTQSSVLLDWELIGDAYVHGIMDGELISSISTELLRSMETEFRIL